MSKGIPSSSREKVTMLLTYCGIFLVSLATLTYEVSLTRIFAIAQGYHFAFMVISIALLGIAASGSFLSVFPSLVKKDLQKTLCITTLSFSLVSPISYLLLNQIPFDPLRISWDKTQLLYIACYYLLLSLPFFFTGLTIAIAISKLHSHVNQLYFADLAGGSLGCLLALVVFYLGDTRGAIGTVFLLGLASSFCFSFPFSKKLSYLLPPLLTILFFTLTTVDTALFQVKLSPYKGLMVALRYPHAELLSTKWNSFSRVDVVKSPAARFAPGLSLNYQGTLPAQLGITVDGDNLNALTHYSGKKEDLTFLSQLPSALPYYLKNIDDVLVLEPKGGLDVLMGLYLGAKNIEGIELNPLVVGAVKDDFKDFSGSLYEQKNVHITIGETRSYLRKIKKRYDLIQLSISNALGASSSGVYGLVEDYLFTVEAFTQYVDHLKEDGFISVTSYLLPPPRQELRVISLILSAMEKRHIPSPGKCLAVIRTWGTITTLGKQGYLTPPEIEKLKNFCEVRSFDLVYYPGIAPEEVNRYNQLTEPLYYQLTTKLIDKSSREKIYRNYPFDLSPVTDDQPFFYHFFKWNKVREVSQSVEGKWQFLVEGAYLVPLIFIQALFLSILLIFIPTLLSTPTGVIRSIPRVHALKVGSYFFWVGMGFMCVEVSLVQKCILFLDHPYYAIALVISALLASTGVGSYLSRRYPFTKKGRMAYLLLLVLGGAIAVYSLLLPTLFNLLLPYHLLMRQCFTVLLLFPLGLLMGIPFPLGIRWLSTTSSHLVPWAWCINGCSSVLSSILAVLIALGGGFTLVLLFAAGCYALATFSLPSLSVQTSLALTTQNRYNHF